MSVCVHEEKKSSVTNLSLIHILSINHMIFLSTNAMENKRFLATGSKPGVASDQLPSQV